MCQNIISQSGHNFASEYLRRNKKMSAGKKPQNKKKLFYWKVYNVLINIQYCIRKYFVVWDAQSHSIRKRSRKDLESWCL